MSPVSGRALVWYPPAGPPLLLTDPANGLKVLWDLTGFMAASYRVTTKRLPGQAGVRLQAVQAQERELEVGLKVSAATRQEYLPIARDLVRRLSPAAGMGRLEVIEGDGSSRSVECICTEGLEGAENPTSGDSTWWKPVLTFFAPQPYAAGPSIPVSWSLAPSGIGWYPILPIRLAPSGIGGRKTIHNPGDVETFPLIVVQGPGQGLVVRNRTTGKAAHLDYTIPAEGPDSVITINTARGAQSVTDGYGSSLFRYLTDDDPSLWSLQPGDNTIDVRLLSAARGSSVTVTFTPLFESL